MLVHTAEVNSARNTKENQCPKLTTMGLVSTKITI